MFHSLNITFQVLIMKNSLKLEPTVPLWCGSHTLNCIIQPASFKVHGVDIGDGEERVILESIRWKRVSGGVPEAAAHHAHALLPQLADADRHDNLIARDHQVLHSCLHHLQEHRELESLESEVIMTTPYNTGSQVLENPSRVVCCSPSENPALHSENWPLIWFWSSVCTARVRTSPPAGSCSEHPSGSPSQYARGTASTDLSKGELGKPHRHVKLSD